MQNAYASPQGYLDIAGFDIGGAAAAIEKIAEVVDLARGVGMPVLYFQNGWDADYVEAGGPGSPNWHKSNALKTMRARPELKGKLLAKGGWDYAIVDRLAPQPGDIVLAKTRYSGFFNSQLDSVLRSRGIRNIVFVGIATNVCVESTLRDGFHLEYFGIMLKDATHPGRPRLPAGRGHLQYRDVLRLDLHRCGFPRGRAADADARCGDRRRAWLRASSIRPAWRRRSRRIPPARSPTASSMCRACCRSGRDGRVVHAGDAGAQTRFVLEAIRTVVEAAGGTMADIAFNHIFLTDVASYAAMNAVYAEYFPSERPARYCIVCALVKPDCLVEIASIAHVGAR